MSTQSVTSITKQLEEISGTMCSDYCKWPDYYLSKISDPDTALETCGREKCDNCPMSQMM